MELRHLRYFEAVAAEMSFSRAAKRLHMAQPPLSRQIRQLEEEIGATLIDRGARPLQLTPAGRFFYEHSVNLLQRVAELRSATHRLAQRRREWFGIGFVPSTLYGLLPDLIRRFRLASPDVEVALLELTTVQQGEALKVGRIDVGFGRLVLDDPEIHGEIMLDEPLIAVLPARHPLLSARRISLEKLAAEPFILYPGKPRPSYADHVLQLLHARGYAPAIAMETNELQTAIGMVAAGLGVALVPESVRRLHRDDVVYRPLSDAGVTSPVIMNFRSDDGSPRLADFRQIVRSRLGKR